MLLPVDWRQVLRSVSPSELTTYLAGELPLSTASDDSSAAGVPPSPDATDNRSSVVSKASKHENQAIVDSRLHSEYFQSLSLSKIWLESRLLWVSRSIAA